MYRAGLEAGVIHTSAPPDDEALRAGLYEGAIYRLGATDASRSLVRETLALLEAELGTTEVRTRAATIDDPALFEIVGNIRRTLFLDRRFHDAARAVLAALGLAPSVIAFDPLRLRVIKGGGHAEPRARAVYYPHRDTWYAHPQGIVTMWIPLHALAPDETFVFYPQRFATPVDNDSEIFDYDAWVARGWSLKIGWQDRDAGLHARYPAAIGAFDGGPEVGFACDAADNLLFSGAHFHRTLPQSAPRARFSLDFRFVHLGDHAQGRGAPNVDNRSRGSALRDYTHPDD